MGGAIAKSGCLPCVAAPDKGENDEKTSAEWMEKDRFEVVGNGDLGQVTGWSREFVERRGIPYQGFTFHFHREEIPEAEYRDRLNASVVRQKELKTSEEWYRADDFIIHGNGRLGELPGWSQPHFESRGLDWHGFSYHWHDEKITFNEYRARRSMCTTGPKVKTSDEWASEDPSLEIRGGGQWRVNAMNIHGWTKAGLASRHKVFRTFNYHWFDEEIPYSEYCARRDMSHPVPKILKSSKQWQYEDDFRIIGEGETGAELPGWCETSMAARGIAWKGFDHHWAVERVTHDEYIARRNMCTTQGKIKRSSEEWFEFEVKHGNVKAMPSERDLLGWTESVFKERGLPWKCYDHHYYEENITQDEFNTRRRLGARIMASATK